MFIPRRGVASLAGLIVTVASSGALTLLMARPGADVVPECVVAERFVAANRTHLPSTLSEWSGIRSP